MGQQYKRNPRMESAPLQEEAILFDPAASKFFVLNRTSSFLWDRLAQPSTVESLAHEVCTRFSEVGSAEALRDVGGVVEQMLALELIVSDDQPREGA